MSTDTTETAPVNAVVRRRWMACAFIEFSAPEFSLDHRKNQCLGRLCDTQQDADKHCREIASVVESDRWLFWSEPENPNGEEMRQYRPEKVIDAALLW